MKICQIGQTPGQLPGTFPMDSFQGQLAIINPATYTAGGADTDERTVTVDRRFLTPPGEVTNAQVRRVVEVYNDRPRGLFMTDTREGPAKEHMYLLATGRADEAVGEFETIDTVMLPPSLGIGPGETIEEFIKRCPQVLGGQFMIHKKNVRDILPNEARYDHLENADKFKAADVAASHIDYYQAQALAQLLAGNGLLEELFGISGRCYADLPTDAQWGLLAMVGQLEFMVNTPDERGSSLTDKLGKKLRAFALPFIVPATDYLALPNGVLPNTVWNWVKDVYKSGELNRVLRGSSWCYGNPEYLRSGYRYGRYPDYRYGTVGFRLAVTPEDSVG